MRQLWAAVRRPLLSRLWTTLCRWPHYMEIGKKRHHENMGHGFQFTAPHRMATYPTPRSSHWLISQWSPSGELPSRQNDFSGSPCLRYSRTTLRHGITQNYTTYRYRYSSHFTGYRLAVGQPWLEYVIHDHVTHTPHLDSLPLCTTTHKALPARKYIYPAVHEHLAGNMFIH